MGVAFITLQSPGFALTLTDQSDFTIYPPPHSLTGMSPFLGDNDMETVNNIAEGEFEYPDPDPEEGYEDITDLAKQFIETLLVPSSK